MDSYMISAKGQITLSDDVMRHLGVRPGEQISLEKLPNGRVGIAAVRPVGKISDLFGILKSKRKGSPLSIEEINKVIAEGWAGKR
jgi:hypothetical protein